MTKQIPLTQGKFAIVDDEDYPELIKHKWYAMRSGDTFYAKRREKVHSFVFSPRRTIYMHRAILSVAHVKEPMIDHANHNGLDNRRCNLRIATPTENLQNRQKGADNTSGYKGVTKSRRKFIAKISINHKSVVLGSFLTNTEADYAYDSAALYYFGEFAETNGIGKIPLSAEYLRSLYLYQSDRSLSYAKLNRQQVKDIRALRNQGATLAELSKRFGVSIAAISMLCNYKTWQE